MSDNEMTGKDAVLRFKDNPIVPSNEVEFKVGQSSHIGMLSLSFGTGAGNFTFYMCGCYDCSKVYNALVESQKK